MNVVSYVFGIVSAALALFVVVEMLRRRRLRERHAIWWLIAGLAALTAGIFPQTLGWAASLLGIEVPINLVFFVSTAVLFLVCLQSSSELTKLEARTRTLAEESALLKVRVSALESGGSGASANGGPAAPEPERHEIHDQPERRTGERGEGQA